MGLVSGSCGAEGERRVYPAGIPPGSYWCWPAAMGVTPTAARWGRGAALSCDERGDERAAAVDAASSAHASIRAYDDAGPARRRAAACETHSSRAIATSLLRREAATRSAAGLLRVARTTPTRDRGGARHRRGTAQRTARMLTATLSSSTSAAAARPAPHARRPTTSTPTARVGVCVRASAAVRLSGARSAFVRSSGGGGAATLTACAGRRTTVAPSRRAMRVRRPRQPLRRRNPGGLGSTRQRLVPPPPVRVVAHKPPPLPTTRHPTPREAPVPCCHLPNRLSLPRRRWSGGWVSDGRALTHAAALPDARRCAR